jgi:hypothetical protein
MRVTEEHATKLIAAAIALTSKEFVATLINAYDSPAETPAHETPKAKRGRKPGAAADGERCTWKHGDNQCKNKHVDSTYCTRHAKMAVALSSAADVASS